MERKEKSHVFSEAFFQSFFPFPFEGGDFYSMLFMASALAAANLERLPDAVMCTVLDVKSVW